jgi:metal-responsive CopG/Arc/MetJ family transcriptional regulator
VEMPRKGFKKQGAELCSFGFSIPKQKLEHIDAVKGPYISRSKYILRAVDKALEEEEKQKKIAIEEAAESK